jgi:hypothetical protein
MAGTVLPPIPEQEIAMSWIMQVVTSILVALGFGPLAKELGLKVETRPVAPIRATALTDSADGPIEPPIQLPAKTPAAAPQPAQSMTIDQLGQLLASAGISVTPNKDASGAVVSYSGQLQWSNGWSGPFTFVLSRNSTYIWIDVKLQNVTNVSAVPAPALLKLLQSNGDHGTTNFVVDSSNSLWYYSSWSVDGMTPEFLKQVISSIETTIQDTANLWSQQALGQAPPPPAPPTPPANPGSAPAPAPTKP